MSDIEPLLKPKEVAAWLGVHVNTVKRMGERGDIPFYRIGSRGDRRYRPSDIKGYLDRRNQPHGKRRAHAGDARGPEEG